MPPYAKNESNSIEKTEMAYGMENTIKMTVYGLSLVRDKADICFDYKGSAIILGTEQVWKSYKNLKDRGIKVRFITDIRKDNINNCNIISEIGEIRHLDGFNGNFGILDETDYYAPSISQEYDPAIPMMLHIFIKDIVTQHQYLFNILWNKAIPAEDKIKEIKKGIKPEKIESITDTSEIETRYIHLLKSATNEILLIFPTVNSMRRQFYIGVFEILKKNIDKHNNLKIRILFPSPTSILSSSSSSSNETSKEKTYQEYDYGLDNISTYKNNVSIHNIEPSLSTKLTILVIDRKESLVIEVKNDLKEKFVESIGFGTYSNSTATVISYVSLFESFWSYSDIVERLKRSEELQKDFVQIAAHELRNPIQPILGLSSFLMWNKPKDENDFQNIAKIINRNAKKLIQLTNDILDVTKIETNNLVLNKELFSLMDLMSDIIQDYDDQLKDENVKLICNFLDCNKTFSIKDILIKDNNINEIKSKSDISIYADKTRISQVISNLLSNAIKFTNEGTIEIIFEKKEDYENKALINIKDTGQGIDQSIIPKLFSKFTTKSKGGTGLGLFISKSIIESHGGKIHAYNNKDGKGATFGFSLPLV